jgi:hypothetical protein
MLKTENIFIQEKGGNCRQHKNEITYTVLMTMDHHTRKVQFYVQYINYFKISNFRTLSNISEFW